MVDVARLIGLCEPKLRYTVFLLASSDKVSTARTVAASFLDGIGFTDVTAPGSTLRSSRSLQYRTRRIFPRAAHSGTELAGNGRPQRDRRVVVDEASTPDLPDRIGEHCVDEQCFYVQGGEHTDRQPIARRRLKPRIRPKYVDLVRFSTLQRRELYRSEKKARRGSTMAKKSDLRVSIRIRISRDTLTLVAALLLCWPNPVAGPCSCMPVATSEREIVTFDIPASTLPQALRAFARQSRVELVFAESGFDDIRTQAVVGSFSRERALGMLVAGTGLRVGYGSDDSSIVQSAGTSPMGTIGRAETDVSDLATIVDAVGCLPQNLRAGGDSGSSSFRGLLAIQILDLLTDEVRLPEQHDVVLVALKPSLALGRRVQNDRASVVDFGNRRARVGGHDREPGGLVDFVLVVRPDSTERERPPPSNAKLYCSRFCPPTALPFSS